MILPSSYAATAALLLLVLLCQGSWANSFKAADKLRFELYYFDFAFGAGLAALLIAFTAGTLGFDGFSFLDDLTHASKTHDLAALLAGGLFNLGNMLLVAGIAECGLAVTFIVGLGTAAALAAVFNIALRHGGNPVLLAGGAILILFAVLVCILAFRVHMLARVDELVRTGQLKSTRRRVGMKGVYLAAVAGLLIGSSTPLVSWAVAGDAGLGPYSISFLLAAGVAASAFLFNLFFMNLPVSGPPLEIPEYFQIPIARHLFGLAGGAVWFTGLAAFFIASASDADPKPAPSLYLAAAQGAMVLAALWGLFYWKEFQPAEGRVRAMLFIVFALLLCGIGLLAVAPANSL